MNVGKCKPIINGLLIVGDWKVTVNLNTKQLWEYYESDREQNKIKVSYKFLTLTMTLEEFHNYFKLV